MKRKAVFDKVKAILSYIKEKYLLYTKKIRNRWNGLSESQKLWVLKQIIAVSLLGCIIMLIFSFPIRIIISFPLPEGWDQSSPSIVSAGAAIVFIVLGIILVLITFYCNYLTKNIIENIKNNEINSEK